MREKGFLTDGLNDFVSFLNDNIIFVEIGSYAGESTEIFVKSNKITLLYAIDPWIDNYDPKLNLKTSMVDVKKIFDEKMKSYSKVKVLKMTSVEAAKHFSDNSVDVVYIDGDHKYESVKKAIQTWLPKIKNGGLITGHDITSDNVRKAIDELLGDIDIHFADTSWAKEVKK